jgi:hypothetical protein
MDAVLGINARPSPKAYATAFIPAATKGLGVYGIVIPSIDGNDE